MNRAGPVLGVALGLGLAACATPTPAPAPIPVVISQPYFEPVLVAWAIAYRQELDGPLPFDLRTETRVEGQRLVQTGEADLLITAGDIPDSWFATPLGPQALAVVVHPDNPVRDLTLEELRDLLAGRAATWSSVGGRAVPVQPVVPLPGEPFADLIDRAVLNSLRPWSGSYLAPTAEAAAQVVAEDPGAIAFLPLAAVADGVRLMRIGGVLPGEATLASSDYPLTLDLMAFAPDEPEPPLRDFLVWIQSRTP